MAMPKGSKNPNAGRKKGTPNKDKQAIRDKLAELDCDPIAGMAKLAKIAMDAADYTLAGNMYKELAQYVQPKLKAIEITGDQEKPVAIQAIELIPLETTNTDTE